VPTGAQGPNGLWVADYDEMNGPDISVIHESGFLVLLTNDGVRAWNPQPPTPLEELGRPRGIFAGGMDEDKDIDVVINGSGAVTDGVAGSSVLVLRNNGDATFTQTPFPAADGPSDVALADLDLDGDLDVVSSSGEAGVVSLFLNEGDGTLAPGVDIPVGAEPPSLTVSDLDGDGDPDIAVVRQASGDGTSSASVLVLRNNLANGQAAFAPLTTLFEGEEPTFVLSDDLDNDGDPDFVALNAAGVSPEGAGGPNPIVVQLTNVTLQGDVNRDGSVDMLDLNIVLCHWSEAGPEVEGDANHDGIVDFIDLNIVLSFFGDTTH
jgi:hypothetical protein